LRESEERFRLLVEGVKDYAIIMLDPAGRVISWNPGAEYIKGYQADEIIGRHFSIFYPAEEIAQGKPEQELKTAEAQGHCKEEGWRVRQDGSRFWANVLITALRDDHGNLRGFAKVTRDITEQKQAEKALRESQAQIAGIIGSATDAIITIDEEQRIVIFNRAAEQMFHCRADEAIGEPIDRFIPERYRAAHRGYITTFGATQETRRRMGALGDLYGLRADGEEFPIEASISQIEMGGKKLFTVILRNITERKLTEEALRAARDNLETKVAERTRELEEANIQLREVDRLKSEFLATMSHELRTPLNSIIGFTGIILQGLAGPTNDEQRKQLSMVYGSAKHLLGLISDLLDLSRIESGKVEFERKPVKLEEVIAEVANTVAPLAQQKGLLLKTDIAAPLPLIESDRKRVFQVLLNLASNAVKFTEQGEVQIACAIEDNRIKVTVSDTGIGIKQENLKLLFEAFRQIDGSSQRRYEGTGLGLHLSKRLVTMLGGNIWAESEYGRGSRFSFTLPIHQKGIVAWAKES
jgi:PAS domain S-box-containing protein